LKNYIGKVLSIMALAISIGLNVFEYGLKIYDAYGVSGITYINNISDPQFASYISSLFIYLIIPGIISIPLFIWLIPTSWLLDDSGILFYKKVSKRYLPEDLEPIGVWFSSYLKGFLGIGAVFSYISFILNSPFNNALEGVTVTTRNDILVLVFGYILIASALIGVLMVIAYELLLPYNVKRLITKLEKQKIDIKITNIKIEKNEEITSELINQGYLIKSKDIKTEINEK